MESMIQSQKDYIQSQNNFFNTLEAQMSRLINKVNDRNEKTLPITFSAIPDYPSQLIGTKNHGILETSTKIQFDHIILNLINIKPLKNW